MDINQSHTSRLCSSWTFVDIKRTELIEFYNAQQVYTGLIGKRTPGTKLKATGSRVGEDPRMPCAKGS